MIQTLQKGKNIHTVYKVGNKHVVKIYTNRQAVQKEVWGVQAWQRYGIPHILPPTFSLGKIIAYKYIQQDKKVLNRAVLLNHLGEIYAQLYTKSTFHHASEWEVYMHNLIHSYAQIESIVQGFLGDKAVTEIQQILATLGNIDWSVYRMIPLHRDIHLGNFLVNQAGNMLLFDFEHAMPGPIEYEFANMIFWDDAESIDYEGFVSILKQRDIPVCTTLVHMLIIPYFIEQMIKASETKDKEKVALLLEKITLHLSCHNGRKHPFTEGKIAYCLEL